jgi:hypothetical protein
MDPVEVRVFVGEGVVVGTDVSGTVVGSDVSGLVVGVVVGVFVGVGDNGVNTGGSE